MTSKNKVKKGTSSDGSKPQKSDNPPDNEYKPIPEYNISNPQCLKHFTHEKKMAVLKALLNDPKTIMELSNELGLNPGTVKRHLEDLIKDNLVQFSHVVKNKFNITMKFYRATAIRYHFEWDWPDKENK